jgi:bacterial surface proteins containing Ig-like domains
MKNIKKVVAAVLGTAMLSSVCVTAGGAFTAFSDAKVPVTAGAEEATERKDVKITKVNRENNTALCVYFDLEGRTGNGTNVNNADEVGDYLFYNRKSCKNAFFDVHMRSNMFWFYAKAGTTLEEGDTVTFRKGLHFPVVTNDGVAATEYKDFLADTVVFEYTADGWVNKTEADKETEQKVNVTGLGGGVCNGETFKTDIVFPDGGDQHNYANVHQNWVETMDYILYNGEPFGSGAAGNASVNMMSGNFYVYPNGHKFQIGDTISILEGLHMPADPVAHWVDSPVPNPSYKEQIYFGYISETYTIECTDAGWIRQSVAAEANTLIGITAVTENEATATLPATYSFTMNFDLRVSKDELSSLEEVANYAENIYINGKSVKVWNDTTPAENNDGEEVPAISLSAYGAGITVTVIAETNIVKTGENTSVKIAKEFVCTSGNYLEADIERFYIEGLTYWSDVTPYEIEQKQSLTIASVANFEVIDDGANGAIDISFNEAIADKPLLWYNCHPEYIKTLPPAYPVDMGDEFASSGATLNFIEHVYVNGKSIAEYWTELSGAEAKASRFQCHILTTNKLSIRTAASNGFDGNSAITVVLKEGLTFFNGAYLDHDITITYTPASGETPASTSYTVNAKTITLTSDKTSLKIGETAQLSAEVAPADVTGEIEYVSSDNSIASVSADGVVTAKKAGTVKLTAKIGGVVSNEVTITVNAPEPPEDSSSSNGNSSSSNGNSSSSDSENESKGCGSVVSAGIVGTLALCGAAILLKKKKD